MDDTELRNSLAALHSASFAWAMACCRDRELAEEVLQSVYIRVLDGRARHHGRSSFTTWLFTVIRNAVWDRRRRQRWSRVVRLDFASLSELAGSTHCGHSIVDKEDEHAMIRAALDALPERQRQVAHLVFYQNLTVAEAATVIGVSVGTARQHYARAKQSLKSSLTPLRNRADETLAR